MPSKVISSDFKQIKAALEYGTTDRATRVTPSFKHCFNNKKQPTHKRDFKHFYCCLPVMYAIAFRKGFARLLCQSPVYEWGTEW